VKVAAPRWSLRYQSNRLLSARPSRSCLESCSSLASLSLSPSFSGLGRTTDKESADRIRCFWHTDWLSRSLIDFVSLSRPRTLSCSPCFSLSVYLSRPLVGALTLPPCLFFFPTPPPPRSRNVSLAAGTVDDDHGVDISGRAHTTHIHARTHAARARTRHSPSPSLSLSLSLSLSQCFTTKRVTVPPRVNAPSGEQTTRGGGGRGERGKREGAGSRARQYARLRHGYGWILAWQRDRRFRRLDRASSLPNFTRSARVSASDVGMRLLTAHAPTTDQPTDRPTDRPTDQSTNQPIRVVARHAQVFARACGELSLNH